MVIQHNIAGMNANRQLNISTGLTAKSSEKLSSGYKINRAADDAAGLAISEKMRRQIRGLTQASANAQDGVSWCQIADGALNEVSDMLQRANVLAVKAANDTLLNDDRNFANQELQKLGQEIDRVHSTTQFNNIDIFADDGYAPNTVTSPNKVALGFPNGSTVEITVDFVDSSGNKVDLQESSAVGQDTTYADTAFAQFIKDAAANAVSNLYDNFPSLFSNAASQTIQVGLNLANIDGASNTLASASLQLSSNGTSTTMTYWMTVDSSDYSMSNYSSMTDAQKADLAAVIAHEMTHLAMYDTLTSGMFSGFPDWFVEGAAQTSSGDNGWVSNYLNSSSTDAAITNYMSVLTQTTQQSGGFGPYGAGYLATMYLGYAVSAKDGNTAVTSANIASGLDKLMNYMATTPASFDTAIKNLTNYTGGQSAFENAVKSGAAEPLAFIKNLLAAKGTNGAGSIFDDLSKSEATVFAPSSLSTSAQNYIINSDNTKYANYFGTGYTIPEKEPGTTGGGGGGSGSGGDDPEGSGLLYLQVGSENSPTDRIELKRFNISLDALTEYGVFDISTRDKALSTIETVKKALLNVNSVRSYYGSLQNRLDHTIRNLDNVVENTQSAESLIRDTDMAEEMVRYSNQKILEQAGQAMLAQANQTNQGVLALLQ